MKALEIETLLKNAFMLEHLSVDTQDEVHFEINLVSEIFTGQTRIQRQRTVYTILGPLIQSGAIHAVALKTFTAVEWQQAGQRI